MPRKLATHYFWMCVRVFVEEISIMMDAVDFSGGSVTKNRPADSENPMDRGAWQATVHRVAELFMTEIT